MRSFIEAHLGSRQVARVIYGAIIGMAVVVVLEHHPPPAWSVVVSLVGTAVAVGLAELYSELIGRETRTRHTAEPGEVRHLVDDVIAVGFGISFPAVFFLLAVLGAIEDDTAFKAAKWSGLGLISLYGFAGGRMGGASVLASVLQGLAVGLIGGALIGLKALVH